MGLRQQSLLLAFVVSIIISSPNLINGLNSTEYCNSLSEFVQNNISTLSTCDVHCKTCFGSSWDQCLQCSSLQDSVVVDIEELCTAANVTLEVMNCTSNITTGDENNKIFGIPKLTFGLAVGVPGLVILIGFLCCCCCCCCYYFVSKRRMESIKMNLINQPELESSLHQLEEYNTAMPAEDPPFNMQALAAATLESYAVPSSAVQTIELPSCNQHIPRSHSSDDIRESLLNGTVSPDKGGGYMKMMSIGTSKSCQNFMDEEIYVEPDQTRSCNLFRPTGTLTHGGDQQQTDPVGIKQTESHYSNQDIINTQSINEQQDKYQNVGAALRGDVENEYESSQMEYYNFIPNEGMYMYMQSGHSATVNTIPRISREEDRERLRSEPTRGSKKYVNFSKEQQLNQRLPGAEYGEFSGDTEENESAATAGMECSNGPNVDTSQEQEANLYANFSDDEDLYTTMT